MTGEFRLGWITNTQKDDAEKVARELLAGHKNRAIFIGNPKPTDTYTKQQLMEMGILGLYDCHPESILRLDFGSRSKVLNIGKAKAMDRRGHNGSCEPRQWKQLPPG